MRSFSQIYFFVYHTCAYSSVCTSPYSIYFSSFFTDELPQESSTLEGEECEEDEGEAAAHTPPHHYGNPHPFSPYSRPPYHPYPPHFPRRGGAPHHGYRHFDKRFDKNFDRHGGFDRYPNENLRNFENRGPYGKPPFYERHYYYDKYYGRPPFCADPNFKFGYVERGRRPFRPYGRHGFFHRGFSGYLSDGGHPKDLNGYAGQEEEEEEDWEEIRALEQSGMEGGERPSQPVHTVMINNEEYTKIQTPRQEVNFKKKLA
nr:uncharacterized protein LOC128706494 [Cherax quadricarinatus]